MDSLKDLMVLFRMNRPEGPKEYMGNCVAGLGTGFFDETMGGRAGPWVGYVVY